MVTSKGRLQTACLGFHRQSRISEMLMSCGTVADHKGESTNGLVEYYHSLYSPPRPETPKDEGAAAGEAEGTSQGRAKLISFSTGKIRRRQSPQKGAELTRPERVTLTMLQRCKDHLLSESFNDSRRAGQVQEEWKFYVIPRIFESCGRS